MKPKFAEDLRGQLLIDKELQPFLIKSSIVSTITTLILVEGAHAYYFWSFKQQALKMGIAPNHLFFQFIDEQSAQMWPVMAVLAVFILAATSLITIYLSNRIAGPIYHLREYLKDFLSGKTKGRLEFREKDFFKDLPELVNRLRN